MINSILLVIMLMVKIEFFYSETKQVTVFHLIMG